MSFMSRCDRGGWEQSFEGQGLEALTSQRRPHHLTGSLLRLFDIKQQLETLLSPLQPVSASEVRQLDSRPSSTERLTLSAQLTIYRDFKNLSHHPISRKFAQGRYFRSH